MASAAATEVAFRGWQKRISQSEYFSLRNGYIRMSWHPFNLYNLTRRKEIPDLTHFSAYQQKWLAKQWTRGYFLPEISERQLLQRHFQSNLPLPDLTQAERKGMPPVQCVAFGKLERRVDVVLFRAHFVSSTIQVRGLLARNYVRVNGQICRMASYELQDGDMVTVDPRGVENLQPHGNEGRAYRKRLKETQEPPELVANMKFSPHPWMLPFLFTPDYLEVSYKACSVIFLRSPMPRANRTEIPSPDPASFHKLVYEWYAAIYKKQRQLLRSKVEPPTILNGRIVRIKRGPTRHLKEKALQRKS